MLKNIVIAVNAKGSKGSLALARALHIRRQKGTAMVQQDATSLLISWGHSKLLMRNGLNKPEAVNKAADKRLTFAALKAAGLNTVKWTLDKAEANEWVNSGYTVLARTKVRAAGGRGIVVCKIGNSEAISLLPDAPLYTRYQNKEKEYRVHVFKGKVIDVTQKRRVSGIEERSLAQRLVRSYDNNWVYCRADMIVPLALVDLAKKAVAALGLDFGAVDIITKGEKCYLVEINTAPGLEGTTLAAYVKAFKEYIYEHYDSLVHRTSGSAVQPSASAHRGGDSRRVERAHTYCRQGRRSRPHAGTRAAR